MRRIALALPEATEGPDQFRFFVAGKAFVWRWLERIHPKRRRVPHYDGYPAILVRLAAIEPDLLEVILTDGWRSGAPKRLLAETSRRGKAS